MLLARGLWGRICWSRLCPEQAGLAAAHSEAGVRCPQNRRIKSRLQSTFLACSPLGARLVFSVIPVRRLTFLSAAKRTSHAARLWTR